jgi:Flp pilus assembly pilin Flp
MLELLRRAWLDERGQDIPEYALMLTLVLLIALAAITAIGNNASAIFQAVADALKAATP